MAFRLLPPDQAFPLEVEVAPPGGGKPGTCTLQVAFLPDDEALRLAEEGNGPYLRRIVRGWSGIEDHEGNAIAHSDEAVAQLAEVPYFTRQVAEAYSRWRAGLAEKNSETPPSP